MPAMLVAMLVALVLSVLPAPARAAELSAILGTIRWGESSAELAQRLGTGAVRLKPPIEFGDSLVDIALRDFQLGGYPFAVYFQMDKKTGGLMRVMLERQRHGANPLVYRAVVAALQRDYGAPATSCGARARRANGYQAAGERIWLPADLSIRAVFRDTTMEAGEGCVTAAPAACGLTGHLFVQITPRATGAPACF
jgi:hypothetical protein